MKKFLIVSINFLMILALSILTNINNTPSYAESIPITSNLNGYYSKFKSMNVPKDKKFLINFNKEIDEKSITKDTLMVIDKNGKIMNTEIHLCTDNKTIIVLPPKEGYIEGEQYAILIKKGIKALDSSVIKKQVVMIFTVKSKEDLEKEKIKQEKINNNKPIKKDSIETIVKTLEGKRSGNQKKGFYESEDPIFWYKLHVDYEQKNKFIKEKDMYNVSHYKDYINSMKILHDKYKNKNYKEITDYDYYKKLPNLTINFNNCNNDNDFISSSLNLVFLSHNVNDFPKDLYTFPYPCEGKPKYQAQVEIMYDESKGFPLCQFIWRPDLEKQMVEEVNQRRKAKGLKPLTLSNDLTAIGKYSAKRSYLCFSHYYLGYTLPCSISCNFKSWANGTIPYAFVNTNNKKYNENVNPSIQEAICLEDHSKELFGYNKPVKCISESSCVYKNAKDFISNWEQQQLFDEGKNPNYNSNFKSFMRYYPESVPKEKYHAPIKLEKNIYNPNVTEIGVGCIYAPPLNEGDINGCVGYFIVLS
ncbi:hypothetical protein Z969_05895 [Clostridium novyi A str. 4570]|uniref:SbsA Ig-like domain-containing protein n=1 Tax=Clostridium novyi A str. 4570 TaxID=1444290 RepID=A0AA88ZN88_CLONO|nr:Ig-like domain-containing protein [Clostridium novyi]KGN02300.1 hypothetical protein Z969_05895 [Clostridium novyi A str. 4570]